MLPSPAAAAGKESLLYPSSEPWEAEAPSTAAGEHEEEEEESKDEPSSAAVAAMTAPARQRQRMRVVEMTGVFEREAIQGVQVGG